MTPYIAHAIEWVITAILAGVVGFASATIRKRKAHDDAMEQGMRALMRKQIVDAYDHYHNQEHRLTVERKSEIDEMYAAYHALGGNGTITHMYNEIDNDLWIERE